LAVTQAPGAKRNSTTFGSTRIAGSVLAARYSSDRHRLSSVADTIVAAMDDPLPQLRVSGKAAIHAAVTDSGALVPSMTLLLVC
jgi:hypothetical protein